MATKIVERKWQAAKWRYFFKELAHHDIEHVYIKGLKHRFELIQDDRDSFLERVNFDQVKDFDEAPNVLQATPTIYVRHGSYIYLWPAPMYEWTVELHLSEKEHEASAG